MQAYHMRKLARVTSDRVETAPETRRCPAPTTPQRVMLMPTRCCCVPAEGQQLQFANTYHLLLHPGADVVAAAGGLHAFMNRQRPLITDSGGFQVGAC